MGFLTQPKCKFLMVRFFFLDDLNIKKNNNKKAKTF